MYCLLQVVLSSRGNIGELEVVLPNNHIRNPRTHGTSVSHLYAYKFSKSALTGMQGAKATYSSQVSIDSNGLLKVCPSSAAPKCETVYSR